MNFTFQSIGRIVHGHGCLSEIGDEVRRLNGSRALLITDKGLVARKVHQPVLDALTKAGIPVEVFSDVVLDPTPESIDACGKMLKDFGADILIGLGGGSTMDSTKAVAVHCTNSGPLVQYFGVQLVPNPCMPTILIPTTSGTGSEMTCISVLEDAATNSKKAIVSDYIYARTVLLDPDLTLSLPPSYTAYTGLDAFVHAMESYVNLSATPFTECLTFRAMEMIAGSIRRAYAKGSNKEARAQMLYASAMAGMGFSNTQNGVIHALAMAAPADHHVHHGLLVAALAPMGMTFNFIGSPEKYARIARLFGCKTHGRDIFEQAAMSVSAIVRLLEDLNIEPGLKAYGIRPDEIRGIAERAAATGRLMDNNPRQATADELEALMKKYY